MGHADSSQVTQLLTALGAGDRRASDRLLPLIHAELGSVARERLADSPSGQTLLPTTLVQDAYSRLVDQAGASQEHRRRFFNLAAQAIRGVLVQRARQTRKQGLGRTEQRVAFDDSGIAIEAPEIDILALEDALDSLREHAPGKAEIVHLCYFLGLSVDEAAATLQQPAEIVSRDWRYARAWLLNEMTKRETRAGRFTTDDQTSNQSG